MRLSFFLGLLACVLSFRSDTDQQALIEDYIPFCSEPSNTRTQDGKTWTRILACQTSSSYTLNDVDSIKTLATSATQIRICNPDGRYVTSNANTYPIQNLRQGKTISFPLDGSYADANNIAATWTGDSDLLAHMWNSCGQDKGLSTALYWACNNQAGLHLFSTLGGTNDEVCEWVWNAHTNQKITVWVDAAAPSYGYYPSGGSTSGGSTPGGPPPPPPPPPPSPACTVADYTGTYTAVSGADGTTQNGAWTNGQQTTDKALDGNLGTQWNAGSGDNAQSGWNVNNWFIFGTSTSIIVRGLSFATAGDTTHDAKTWILSSGASATGPWTAIGNGTAVASSTWQTFDIAGTTTAAFFKFEVPTRQTIYQVYLKEIKLRTCAAPPPPPAQYGGPTYDWKCLPGLTAPLSLTPGGDVQCMSLDGVNCVWDGADCNAKLNTPNLKPLVCGAPHLAVWHITGYDTVGHWCNVGKAYFYPTPKGVYRLVFRQTFSPTSAFSAGKLNLNSDDATAFNYAILDQLETYRLPNGAFQFKITWPHTTPNEWIQTSNPTTSATVTGYQAVNITHTDNNWFGLASNGVYSLLDGSSNDWWYYAIGAFQPWNGGIPSNKDAAQVVELYVYDTTGKPLPDYTAGPKVYNGQYRLVSRQTMPNYFAKNILSVSADDATAFNFATLDQLEKYRLSTGGFQFRLSWPGLANQDWVQTSNPSTDATVTGYSPIDIHCEDNAWGGLHKDGTYALISGSTSWPSLWWYAVGQFQPWSTGIPAGNTPAQVAQLYVLDQTGVTQTTETGNYRLVFRQTWDATNPFSAGKWNVNENDPTAFNYAILDKLESYRLTKGAFKGSFKFKISWPHTPLPNVWVQSSNPTQSATVTGYQPIAVAHNDMNWFGLATNGQYALLDGSSNDWWYYAIGSFQVWGGGIPSNKDATQVVELHVWDDTGAPLPDYTRGPAVWNGVYRLVSRQTVPYFFGANQLALNKNDATNFNYAALDELEKYRSNGVLQFRLSWPGVQNQEWKQTSNPSTDAAPVAGYAAVSTPYADNMWGGLHKDGTYALISGGTNWPATWWYAVGSFQAFQGGIPSVVVPTQVTQLYVLDTTGVPASNNGFYRLVFRQTYTPTSAFTANTLSLNANDPTAFNFAILDQLEQYRLTSGACKGKLRFRISWPHTTPNEWVQTSNPTTTNTVSGYEAVSVSHMDNYWYGLASNGVYSLLEGSSNDWWYYAIGSFQPWNGGIPSNKDATQAVELHVFDDTGATAPDYSVGPINPFATNEWTCVPAIDVPLSLTAGGDVQCMATDATNCLWSGACSGKLSTGGLKPLVCGAPHKAIYGITGYDTPGHWCATGKSYFANGKGRYYLIARQTVPYFFTSPSGQLNVNDASGFNYANLGAIAGYKCPNGAFQFRLTWPGQTANEWIQTSNPATSNTTTGYTAISVTHTDNFWGGLHQDNKYALLSGGTNFPATWWYAVGSFQAFQGGIPGFNVPVQVVQLYSYKSN